MHNTVEPPETRSYTAIAPHDSEHCERQSEARRSLDAVGPSVYRLGPPRSAHTPCMRIRSINGNGLIGATNVACPDLGNAVQH